MMGKSIATGTIGSVLLAAVLAASASATAAEADLILKNGEFYTPSGWAQSIAIRNGVILAVGDATAVAPFTAAGTRVIDLNGAAVVPGLHDMHVHPLGSGLRELACHITQGSSVQQMLDAVKGCVATHKKGEWITGGQWEASAFGKQPMHRSLLDRISPDNPVALNDISGHSLWANSKALEVAGVTAQTQPPPGGVIERDSKGQPNGVFRESAEGLAGSDWPQGPTWARTTQAVPPVARGTEAALRSKRGDHDDNEIQDDQIPDANGEAGQVQDGNQGTEEGDRWRGF